MPTSASKVQLERLSLLVLARLLPKTKRAPTRTAVLGSVAECLSMRDAPELAEQALEHTLREGWVSEPLTLTAKGRHKLQQSAGVDDLPEPKNWGQVRRKLLVDLSLGAPAKRAKVRSADQLAASILTVEHRLGEDALSLKAVVDRLAWRALGVETDAPFDAARVQRHLLREIVAEDARVDLPTWRRLLAVRATGAKRGDAEGLRQGALARWVEGRERAQATPQPGAVRKSDNDNSKTARPALPDLASAVVRAAREPEVARFHDDRAFIGSIWEHMRGRDPVGGMSLADFKEQLVAAHRAGLLRMTRADLVGAMDVDEVQRSEATYLGATFHFVALDAAGAR